MKVEILENEKDKMKVEIHENTTLVSLINENLWQQKGMDVAAFKVDHPYLSKPVLMIKSRNPKKALLDAAEQIIEDAKDLRKKFQAELK